jgi:hypothetical protein
MAATTAGMLTIPLAHMIRGRSAHHSRALDRDARGPCGRDRAVERRPTRQPTQPARFDQATPAPTT